MNQRQQILASDVPTTVVAGTTYKGQPPVYKDISQVGQLSNIVKISKGIPFVKVK